MTVPLLPFATSDDVRAALGVAEVEMPDQRFVDAGIRESLVIELTDWLPTYGTVYTEGTTTGATTAQIHKYNILRMYAVTYAAHLMAFAELGLAKEIGDGKTGEKRFNVDFEKLRDAMKHRSDNFRGKLTEIISGVETTRPAMIGAATPAYDPVTGV